MKVGIQGSRGSYHEAVTIQRFGAAAEIVYISTFQEVFQQLADGEIDTAVAAIANNRYGFIPESFSELMTRHKQITITGEAYLPVKHQLLGVKGSGLTIITEVHSQAPALGQCHEFLQRELPQAVLIEDSDTALAAQHVAELQDPTKAAIASTHAGELYGLEVLAQDIQDDQDNITRFLILKRPNSQPQQGNKSTILLKTAQTPGALADALQQFKQQGINISTLHSTFLPNTGFEMQFLLEFDAGAIEADPVFAALRTQQAQIELLGSYPSDTIHLT